MQFELLARRVQSRKVIQLTARNSYESPQLLNRSSCDVLRVHYLASIASETRIKRRDRLANISASEFRVRESSKKHEDNSVMVMSVPIVYTCE